MFSRKSSPRSSPQSSPQSSPPLAHHSKPSPKLARNSPKLQRILPTFPKKQRCAPSLTIRHNVAESPIPPSPIISLAAGTKSHTSSVTSHTGSVTSHTGSTDSARSTTNSTNSSQSQSQSDTSTKRSVNGSPDLPSLESISKECSALTNALTSEPDSNSPAQSRKDRLRLAHSAPSTGVNSPKYQSPTQSPLQARVKKDPPPVNNSTKKKRWSSFGNADRPKSDNSAVDRKIEVEKDRRDSNSSIKRWASCKYPVQRVKGVVRGSLSLNRGMKLADERKYLCFIFSSFFRNSFFQGFAC